MNAPTQTRARRAAVTLTAAAEARVAELMAKAPEGTIGVKLSTPRRGCSGLAYSVDYVAAADPLDEKIETPGGDFYIDSGSVLYLIGSTMDWREDDFTAGFVFDNPNAKGACGCGDDLVDGEHGDDPACRPNQLFAFSLDHPVLNRDYWRPVLEVVQRELLTPLGLRTLSTDHPDYHPVYFGDRRARDAAYHQGTVWAWLIGPFVDAYLKVYPDDVAGARKSLAGFQQHLGEACIGTISEIFDAEPPYEARGCAAQAWSVAEVLRCWIKTSEVPR